MDEDEPATLEGQFLEFSKLMDTKRDGLTITLYRSDYWLRQAKLIDDRKITMTDTGILFNKWWLQVQCGRVEGAVLLVLSTERPITLAHTRFLIFCPFYDTLYCNVTFDTFLCWPPSRSGSVAFQACPPVRLVNKDGKAYRQCGEDGVWIGLNKNATNNRGWTNYTDCYLPEMREIYNKIYNGDEAKTFKILERTRFLEIVGFSVSLIALIVSLIIFWRFRCLQNQRTRIHRNLFSAIMVHVIIRLTLYIDQALIRSMLGEYTMYNITAIRGIDNMLFLCESCYVLLEYANTSMFMWMFVEGVYLHKMVTTNALNERVSNSLYYFTGWGTPALITLFWAIPTALYFGPSATCWWGYNLSSYYWILQGPRLGVVTANMFFLLNIIRVLVAKMQQSNTTELQKIKKAARAALVLLPLLGITNLVNMIEVPLNESWALWYYVTHFFNSFQGFFIALIYCFFNGEVRAVLKKRLHNYLEIRQHNVLIAMSSNSDPTKTFRKRTRRKNKLLKSSETQRSEEQQNVEPEPEQIQPAMEERRSLRVQSNHKEVAIIVH